MSETPPYIDGTNECTPLEPPTPECVTWVHIGDLHMVRPGEQNFLDLRAIVEEINVLFAGKGVSFVYLPGDNADNGSEVAYRAVRECLDGLQLPWRAIVGDHDVHEKSHGNFKRFLCSHPYGSFTAGSVRFFRLNCFSEPRPDSFLVDPEQLAWLETELKASEGLRRVLLMHCYPSDLKQGGEALTGLIEKYGIQVVDMGHTHYNELSNDGKTIYCATRSTGQIEEGPVGYSVVTLDGDDLSWHFKRLGTPSLVAITSPQDVRLETRANEREERGAVTVCVLAWSSQDIDTVRLRCGEYSQSLTRSSSGVWSATLPPGLLAEGVHELTAVLETANGSSCEDTVCVAIGTVARTEVERNERDQDNALDAWPERELLGTQLGPNKNGRKW